MIKFTTGNILESQSDALVNTVNCEGYMGKGIAYQFKLSFPNNYEFYYKACKTGNFTVGELLTFHEDEKTIINFPTKTKWRKKSEYEYITLGMNKLIQILPELNIHSISLPPLGCGNGGLEWNTVKSIILSSLAAVEKDFEIVIYEPSARSSNSSKNSIKKIPKMNVSHLLLMDSKRSIQNFNKLRLQKALYLMNYLSHENYFKFNAHNFEPYSHAIDTLIRDIQEFQKYHNVDTSSAFNLAFKTLISAQVELKFKKYKHFLDQAIQIINAIENSKDLEAFTTILFIIDKCGPIRKTEIPKKLQEWSEYKSKKFTLADIETTVKQLTAYSLIQDSLLGYEAVHLEK